MLQILESQLGPLTWPLLLCSVVTAVILLERLVVLTLTSINCSLTLHGLALLQQHGHQPRQLREEMLALWLHQRQQHLASGIRLLQILGSIAPLLGLLGTVIGLIQVFDGISDHRGPIEPALLANGLGIAMKTTAVGLMIAVPAILGAHGFRLWVDRLIDRSQRRINLDNLALEGISTEALT